MKLDIDIPNSWVEVSLGEITKNIQNGLYKPSEFYGSGHWFVRMYNLSADSWLLNLDTLAQVKVDEHEIDRFALKSGDILVNRVNSLDLLGKTAWVGDDGAGLMFENMLIRLQLLASADSLFIAQQMNTSIVRSQMARLAKRAGGQASLNSQDILSLHVAVPPLPEQRKIAEILGTWDEAIATVERLIAALEQRKQGLMQRLLTGEVRFGEFAGNEWRTVQLGEIFSERKETGFESLPLLSITSGQGIVNRDELDRRDTSNADKSKYLRICPGDIGYNTMRMWQGVSSVSDKEGIVSPAYTICTPKDDIDAQFAGYLFQLPEMIDKFRRYSQGLVKDTLNLKFNGFAQIEAQIPLSLREQHRITTVLNLQDQSIRALREYRAELGSQKKGLMQRLLTGNVRVKV